MSISASSGRPPQVPTPITQATPPAIEPVHNLPDTKQIEKALLNSNSDSEIALPEFDHDTDDQTSKELGAAAFSAQEVVFFRGNEVTPLIAHENTYTVQQGSSPTKIEE